MNRGIPICRVCLKTSMEYIDFETPFVTLSPNEFGKPFTYLDCFRECTHIEVEAAGFYSEEYQSFCDACGLDLKITYEFLCRAARSAEVLRAAFLKTHLLESQTTLSGSESYFEDEVSTHECDATDPGPNAFIVEEELEAVVSEENAAAAKNGNLSLAAGYYLNEAGCCEMLEVDYRGNKEESNGVADKSSQQCSENSDFSCNTCSKGFVSAELLNTHLRYHQRKRASEKSDACGVCGKKFSTKSYLTQHMEVHRSERKPHECIHCDKVYISKTALENHMRMHLGDTVECRICGKHFSRQYELNVHMRFHNRDYKFQCETCGKKFAIKGHLRTHMWRHQGLKVQCENCGKLFTSTKALQEHSFVHSEMPFPCNYCGRGYPSKQKFKVHLKSAHSIELSEEELQKIKNNFAATPLQRKKLTLVQAESIV